MPRGNECGIETRYLGTVGMTRIDRLFQHLQRLPLLGLGAQRRRILPLAAAALLICTAVVIGVAVLPPVDPLDPAGEGIVLVPQLGPAATNVLLGLVVLGTLGLGAVAVAYLIVALRHGRNRYAAGNSPPWRAIIIIVLGMLLFYLAVAMVLSLLVLPEEEARRPPVPEEDGEGEEQEEEPEPEPEPLDDGLTAATRARRSRIILITLLAVGFAAVGYFAMRLMRATPEADPVEAERLSEELRRDLAEATELAIAELEAEADFRRAVIGCWAFLELALARHEHPRPRHHTPLEYVRALVVELPALPARALLELTGRYELARFSEHDITRGDRDTALRCLHDIRHTLSLA